MKQVDGLSIGWVVTVVLSPMNMLLGALARQWWAIKLMELITREGPIVWDYAMEGRIRIRNGT